MVSRKMIWEKTIVAAGDTATSAQQTEAWNLWLRGDQRILTGLAALLVRVGAGDKSNRYPCRRVADRMLQTARKAGVIRYDGTKWLEVKE